jgi:protein translocase, SecG subunit
MDIALGIVLLVSSIFLIVAVLMQQGKSHNLSGAIAGGAETFFGKSKGDTISKKLSKVTTIVSILFVVIVIVVYVVQDDTDYKALLAAMEQQSQESVSETVGEEVVDETPADDAGEDDVTEAVTDEAPVEE